MSRAWVARAQGSTLAAALAGVSWLVARALAAQTPLAPDAVVIALLLGMAVRTAWEPRARLAEGFDWVGKGPLEAAIVLLGVGTDLRVMVRAGGWLVAGVVGVTALAFFAGIGVSRACRLTKTHALLVASGNAICGNTAIAAVSKVINAPQAESASAIAFTAILSIAVVLGLPLLAHGGPLSDVQFGALAGMTVYAVPQVLAATMPVSARAGEIATLVKLVRVALLMPLLTGLSAIAGPRAEKPSAKELWMRALPPYLLAFCGLALARTLGWIPNEAGTSARTGAHALTVLAMAGIGLSVAPRALKSVGAQTALAATFSLVLLGALAFAVARQLPAL